MIPRVIVINVIICRYAQAGKWYSMADFKLKIRSSPHLTLSIVVSVQSVTDKIHRPVSWDERQRTKVPSIMLYSSIRGLVIKSTRKLKLYQGLEARVLSRGYTVFPGIYCTFSTPIPTPPHSDIPFSYHAIAIPGWGYPFA